MAIFFRKEAMEELRDPRGLDVAVRLVRARHWLIVAAFGVLVAAAVLWAFFGRLDYRVDGLAVLLHEGSRIYTLEAPADGRIIALHVRRGDTVEKGDLLAELSLPVLEAQIAALKEEIGALESELKERRTEIAREEADDARALDNALKTHESLRATLREREAFLSKHLAALQAASKKGFASRDAVETAREQLLAVRQQLLSVPVAIARLKSNYATRQTARETAVEDMRRTLVRLRGQFAALVARHDEGARITAPDDGMVVTVDELSGRRIGMGEPILTLETTGGRLTAYAFFPLASGKKVAEGMPAFIGPSNVEREIHGVIRARVVKVSILPLDRADLLARLGNEALVKQILATGAPIEAEILLDPDGNGDGFAWTASRAPPELLTPGTLASSEVIVRRVPPVALLMPLLGSLFRGDDNGGSGGAETSR